MLTLGHSSPKTWATSFKKPAVVVAVEEKLDRFNGGITTFGEKVNFGGTQHVNANNEKEKLRNNVGEREEEGLCHYERVSIDLQGKISSDISVDR